MASSSVQLPAPLARIALIFRCLRAILNFLRKRKVRWAWTNVKRALQELAQREGVTGSITTREIDDLCLFAPELLCVHHRERFSDGNEDFIIEMRGGGALAEAVRSQNTDATTSTTKKKKRRANAVSSSLPERVFEAALLRTAIKVRDGQLGDVMVTRREDGTSIAACEDAAMLMRGNIIWDSRFKIQDVTIEDCRVVAAAYNDMQRKQQHEREEQVGAALQSVGGGGDTGLEPADARPPRVWREHGACSSMERLEPEALLTHLEASSAYAGQIVHREIIAGRDAEYEELAAPALAPEIASALAQRGVSRLFAHQATAMNHLRAGASVCISTSTSSGKSLCYIVPILEAMLEAESTACAVFIFPTKALARDQCTSLRDIVERCGLAPDEVAVYDGDTPMHERGSVRSSVRLLITNPDMLHVAVLPSHRQFQRLLTNLRFVVLDEGHSYRGIFGAHVAMVMRRLRRLCEPRVPQFVVCSATLANALEHAQTLTGVDTLVLVDNDGSPRGKKTFALWNPPLNRDAVGGSSSSSAKRKKSSTSKEALSSNGVNTNGRWKRPPRQSNRGGGGNDGGGVADTSQNMGEIRDARALDKDTEGAHIRDDQGPSAADLQMQKMSGDDARSHWRERPVSTRPTKDRRRSPMVEIAILLAECVQHGLQTIAFCKTRKLCELVLAYTREILLDTSARTSTPAIGALASRIAVYRGGYSPGERRGIEQGLSTGSMIGVAATNALELGIDVGELDVTLHLGFPGSIASLWQQSGRAGRRRQESLGIYVAFDGPLDQYFMQHADALFRRPIEAAHVDLSNPVLVRQHIACATFEMELDPSADAQFFGPGTEQAVAALLSARDRVVAPHPTGRRGGLCYIGRSPPARDVSLRAIDDQRFSIVLERTGEVIEEIESCKAFFEVYEGAVYMHQGRPHLCTRLDLASKVAQVKPAPGIKYYTQVVDSTSVHPTAVDSYLAYGGGAGGVDNTTLGAGTRCVAAATNVDDDAEACRCGHSDDKNDMEKPMRAEHTHATVTTRWLGFHRIQHGSGQVFDSVDLSLPDVTFETQCVFSRLPLDVGERMRAKGLHLRDGVHGACHAILNAVPLLVMCNAEDLCTECSAPWGSRYRPERLLLYDAHPGGIGLSLRIAPVFRDVCRRALEMVESCTCHEDDACSAGDGCPGCIHFVNCTEYNKFLHKESAVEVLKIALAAY